MLGRSLPTSVKRPLNGPKSGKREGPKEVSPLGRIDVPRPVNGLNKRGIIDVFLL